MNNAGDKDLVILSIGTAHILTQLAYDLDNYAQIRTIWEKVKEDPNLVGDDNDYHNYSVVLSRLDDYLTAYEIVERGLEQFPYNTDLLADAINYGSNCNKYNEAMSHFDTLNRRPYSSWTWRAFQFSIDFLQRSWNWLEDKERAINGLNLALKLARLYQKYHPSDERSYVAEYELLQNLSKIALDNEDEAESAKKEAEALQVLKRTIESGEYPAVQCSLRYADELFRKQKYEEVIHICNRAMQYGQSSATVRLGYFMYLSAQSREILLYKNENWRDNQLEVETIYREYLASLSDTGNDYKQDIYRRVNILSARTGIKILDDLAGKLKNNEYTLSNTQLL